MTSHPGVSPPSVAYLINQYPKISHTFIRNEIRALEDAGFEVLRIAIRGWDAELLDPVDISEQLATIYVLKGGLHKLAAAMLRSLLKRPLKTVGALRQAIRLSHGSDRSLPYHLMYLAEACLVRELAELHSIGHIHAHFGSNAAEVAMLTKHLNGPSFSFTAHGPEEFDKPYQFHLKEKIDAARFVVGISSFGRSQLYRYTDVENWSKLHVVHCGLGNDYLHNKGIRTAKSNHLICVGRLCEQKGQIVLVRACKILADRGIDFKVTLIGDGEMRSTIEHEINILDLGDNVAITGWCGSDDIRKLLLSSKGLVLPSFAEGLPVVIMEAMALGKPVISTYVAGIPELVRDGKEGFLVYAGSDTHLADAMERLLNLDEHRLHELGKSARCRVAQRHTAADEAVKLGRLFYEAPEQLNNLLPTNS